MSAANDGQPVSRRTFLERGWQALVAKRYQTVAAFVRRTDAEALCEDLRAEQIDVTVIQSSTLLPDATGETTVVEVQVVAADFDAASRKMAMVDRPKLPRQFGLRAVGAAVTVLCVALALIAQLGFFASFWGSAFVLMGGFSVGAGVVCFRRGRASWDWPKASGTIVRSMIEWNGEDYRPTIKYRFSVGGHEHTSDTLSYIGGRISGARIGHELARNAVVRYPAGLDVDVFYDPQRPANAVLERGGKIGDAVLMVGVGLVFITFGMLFLLGIFTE